MGGAAPHCWDSSQVVRRCLKNPVVHGEAGHRDDFLPDGCSVTHTRSPMKGVCLLKAGRCKWTSLSSEVSSSDRLPPPPHRLRVSIKREADSAPGGRAHAAVASLTCLGNSTQDPKEACDSVNLQTRWLSEQACHGDAGDAKGMGLQASVCRACPRAEPRHPHASLPPAFHPAFLKGQDGGGRGEGSCRRPLLLKKLN